MPKINIFGDIDEAVLARGIYVAKTPSPIVHPSHYNQGKIETIEILKELTESYTGFEGFLVGNVVKYLSRANYKGNKLEDLKKAQFYLNRLVAEGEL